MAATASFNDNVARSRPIYLSIVHTLHIAVTVHENVENALLVERSLRTCADRMGKSAQYRRKWNLVAYVRAPISINASSRTLQSPGPTKYQLSMAQYYSEIQSNSQNSYKLWSYGGLVQEVVVLLSETCYTKNARNPSRTGPVPKSPLVYL
jgi:hypothetical protein